MSGFLLDTNVPSELSRARPDPRVARWLEDADDDTLYLSVISIGGLAQTSVFEVCDAPEGQSKVRRSAPGSLPDRSLREIADSTERSLRYPATCLGLANDRAVGV
jgi:predicted nucleic acid-binding protein